MTEFEPEIITPGVGEPTSIKFSWNDPSHTYLHIGIRYKDGYTAMALNAKDLSLKLRQMLATDRRSK